MADQQSAPSGNGRPASTEAAMQIIWFALLASIGGYAAIGYFVIQPGTMARTDPEQLNMMAMVLAAAAVGTGGFAMMAPRILSKMPTVSLYIVRWAMAESVAVFGFMLRILGGNTTWLLLFTGCSALLLLTLRPGQPNQGEQK